MIVSGLRCEWDQDSPLVAKPTLITPAMLAVAALPMRAVAARERRTKVATVLAGGYREHFPDSLNAVSHVDQLYDVGPALDCLELEQAALVTLPSWPQLGRIMYF